MQLICYIFLIYLIILKDITMKQGRNTYVKRKCGCFKVTIRKGRRRINIYLDDENEPFL